MTWDGWGKSGCGSGRPYRRAGHVCSTHWPELSHVVSPRAWIPDCSSRLQRSVNAVGQPALCVLPAFVCQGQGAQALHLEVQTPGRLGAGSCRVHLAVLSACALFFFLLFFSRYRKCTPVQGVPPTSQEPKKSSYQWPDCET